MNITESAAQTVSLDEIEPGMIIAFKRYAWSKRRTAMIVESVDRMRATYLNGRAYHLGHGRVGVGTVSAMFTSAEQAITLIGRAA